MCLYVDLENNALPATEMALPGVTRVVAKEVSGISCGHCNTTLPSLHNVHYTFEGHRILPNNSVLDVVKFDTPLLCPNCNATMESGGFLCDHAVTRMTMNGGRWVLDWGSASNQESGV